MTASRARPRLPRADRPLAAAAGGQRALRGPARPGSSRWWRRSTSTWTGRTGLPAAARDRGGHPRRRRPRPDRRDARPARRGRRLGALQAADGPGRHDPADGGRGRPPADQRAGPLHRPARDRRPGHPPAERVRRRGGVRGLRRERRGRGDQLPPRAAGPARRAGRPGPRSRLPVLDRQRRARPGAARLPRPTVRRAPSGSAYRRSGSSTPGRRTACWPGPTGSVQA